MSTQVTRLGDNLILYSQPSGAGRTVSLLFGGVMLMLFFVFLWLLAGSVWRYEIQVEMDAKNQPRVVYREWVLFGLVPSETRTFESVQAVSGGHDGPALNPVVYIDTKAGREQITLPLLWKYDNMQAAFQLSRALNSGGGSYGNTKSLNSDFFGMSAVMTIWLFSGIFLVAIAWTNEQVWADRVSQKLVRERRLFGLRFSETAFFSEIAAVRCEALTVQSDTGSDTVYTVVFELKLRRPWKVATKATDFQTCELFAMQFRDFLGAQTFSGTT